MSRCLVNECPRPPHRRGYCNPHYHRVIRYGDPLAGGAERQRWNQAACSVEGCETPIRGRALCQYHLQHTIRHGSPTATPPPRKRKRTGKMWKSDEGYMLIYAPDHPNARKGGELAEHTRVMSEKINRPLLPGETVHHINGIRDDNRPENLELWVKFQPYGQRVSDLVEYARGILNLYEGISDV